MSKLRKLPKVDSLRNSPRLSRFSESVKTQAARAAVNSLRTRMISGEDVDLEEAEGIAELEASRRSVGSFRRVINGSGVILHTGLGRARLSDAASEAVSLAAKYHSSVELALDSGRRGDRQDHVRGLLCELTGAEDAHVVNNCAGAVFLSLAALCKGREVILSRGQMVEIGGSFRMPDIVRESGCRLVEVGCTNKTRLSDYASAVGSETAAILRCHPSNFRIVGFTDEVGLPSLRGLCDKENVLLLDDLGSGCLVDTSRFGLPKEPTVSESISAGVDVLMSSCDKLLGGPQAGLLLGKEAAIAAIRTHPLSRALRIDKLTLAALEATLRAFAEERYSDIPAIRYLERSLAEVRRMALKLKSAFGPGGFVEQGETEVGGGSAPGTGVPTVRVGLRTEDPEALACLLRASEPAILGRIEKGVVWLDPRTMEPGEVREVQAVLRRLAGV